MTDDSRNARLTFTEFKATDTIPRFRITKRSTSLDLGTTHWPAAGADFLRLRIRVDYRRLRKPSALTLEMSFADGYQKLIQFVIEPNRWSDVWVYPWDEKQMWRYFSPDESDWRSDTQPTLTRVKLLISPFDWVSVTPGSVRIESVKAVQVKLR